MDDVNCNRISHLDHLGNKAADELAVRGRKLHALPKRLRTRYFALIHNTAVHQARWIAILSARAKKDEELENPPTDEAANGEQPHGMTPPDGAPAEEFQAYWRSIVHKYPWGHCGGSTIRNPGPKPWIIGMPTVHNKVDNRDTQWVWPRPLYDAVLWYLSKLRWDVS